MKTKILKHRRSAGIPWYRNFRGNHFFCLTGFLIFGVLWQIMVRIRGSPALPPLPNIFRTLLLLICDKSFIQHILASIKIIFLGITMAAVIGFAVGLLVFRYQRVKESLLPLIECVRGIAALSLFPLLIIIFGLGIFSRMFVIFWTAWPAIVLSTISSLNVDSDTVDAARVGGAGEWKTITHIRIPMALEGLITGLRIGVGGGWVSLITAEMLGASKGLGFYLLWSSQSFQFEKIYACIIIIAAIGGLMNLFLLLLQKKINLITGV